MTEIDLLVGTRIRRRRRELGMTQRDLGDEIGVRFQQIQKYETGRNRVSASKLWKIAQSLDVPISYFFAHAGDRGIARHADPAAEMETEARELATAFLSLPAEHRRALLSLARAIRRPEAIGR